jgi:alpha-ketoglutaric semialdehyde dehydrogenase
VRRPLGVVALITPWNFPMAIPARKGAPALAFGNAVVLKPSSLAPGPALRLARILDAAGLPRGCWNVVVGRGDIGSALVEDERVDGVSFTGSTEVGRSIGRALVARGVPLQAEMGGHSPVVALADADPERVAEVVAEGAFVSAGQTCTATRRLIVEDRVYDDVLAAVVAATEALVVGPGQIESTRVCPLVGVSQRDQVGLAIERAVSDGAEVLCGGGSPGGDLSHGAFLMPALLGSVTPEMAIAKEEVFGPVCGVIRAADAEEAIEFANAGPFGLSASVVTTNIAQAMRFVREIQAGMVHINRQTIGADPHMPFGGLKESSAGPREQGRGAREFYTHEQTIYLHP